jgi:hypothetical protein
MVDRLAHQASKEVALDDGIGHSQPDEASMKSVSASTWTIAVFPFLRPLINLVFPQQVEYGQPRYAPTRLCPRIRPFRYEELVFIESYPKSSCWCCKASIEGQYQG